MKNELESVQSIFKNDKDEIIKHYGGTGAGVSKNQDEYIILVFTNDKSKVNQQPHAWKDIPVEIKFTGTIKAQSH